MCVCVCVCGKEGNLERWKKREGKKATLLKTFFFPEEEEERITHKAA